jgi:hypothetical protein
MRARKLDDRDDILDRLDQRDRQRPLIDREVPCPTCVVPLEVAGKHELTGEAVSQGAEIACPVAISRFRETSALGHDGMLVRRRVGF